MLWLKYNSGLWFWLLDLARLKTERVEIIVVDLMGTTNVRQINIYKSFSPQHGVSQRDKFNYQLDLIHIALTPSTLLLGDLNLDWTNATTKITVLKTISRTWRKNWGTITSNKEWTS